MKNLQNFDNFTAMMASNLSEGPTLLATSKADHALMMFISGLNSSAGLRSVGLANFAFGNWRTAAALAKAGNTVQVPPLIRLSIEGILYAHLLKEDKLWLDRWNKMHTSKTAAQHIRNSCLPNARAALKRKDPRLAGGLETLYGEMIEIGGHPNLQAVEIMTTYDFPAGSEDGRVYFAQLGNDSQRHLCDVNVLRAADLLLHCAKHIWPESYDFLGIIHHHSAFRAALSNFIQFSNHRRE